MKCARILGRVTCSRQYETLRGKKLLLIQPLDWENGKPKGSPLVAADACGSGSTEFVYWVASREAAVAFEDLPPVDAAIIGIIEGHQVKDFRSRERSA
ncbi:MAG: ethanolamine utilization protein EutN [Elusimicrobia bacterium]|nr:MAG: ethanolamine utilization protein EutN [Elusimicrobiota bacterium]